MFQQQLYKILTLGKVLKPNLNDNTPIIETVKQ